MANKVTWLRHWREAVSEGWRTAILSNEIFFSTAGLGAGGFTLLTDYFDLSQRALRACVGNAAWVGITPPWVFGTIVFLAVFAIALSVRTISLRADLEPRMTGVFSMEDPGCHVKNTSLVLPQNPNIRIRADYYRIKVEANGLIKAFRGTLISIKSGKNGVLFQGENLNLTPAHAGDDLEKDIRDKHAEYLDVLRISEDNQVMVTTYQFRYPTYVGAKLATITTVPDKYDLEILISADDSPTLRKTLRLTWTGDWKSAKVSDITHE